MTREPVAGGPAAAARPTDLLRVPVLLAVESAIVVGLHRLGQVPALRIDTSSPAAWLASVPPEDALAAVVRLVATCVAVWLLVSTVVYLLALLSGVPSLRRTTARVTLPAVRTAIERGVAVGALAGVLSVPLPATAQPVAPPPTPEPPAGTADVAPLPPGVSPPRERADPPAPTPSSGTRAVHEVVPGDHLWGIAGLHLSRSSDVPPDTPAIARYWLRVVEDNREGLRSGDPDLIHPGESVSLPAVTEVDGGG